MKILVVGVGAVGGYFGGRLVQAGRDVTFLVRPLRADQLRKFGLRIVSPHGDAVLQPKTVLAQQIEGFYDLILLGVKAYTLEPAMADFAAAVGPATMILPMLNGMRHMQQLATRFGERAVLGGVCMVATDLGNEGEVVQLTQTQKLVYGETAGGLSARVGVLDQAMQGANFVAQPSPHIMRDMWEKWVLLASLGALTCLLRGNVGEIEAAGGAEISLAILREASSIAQANGFAPDEAWSRRIQQSFTTHGSTLTSSLYRDLLKGNEVAVDQILGDLLGRSFDLSVPLLRAAFVNLSIYRARLPHRSTKQ